MNPLLETAIAASLAAGREVMSLYHTTTFEIKSDGSPVTVADQQAHAIIFSHLTHTGIDILSEESDGRELPYPQRIWIIDPLDGTKDFLNKTGDFAIMIGLLEYGRPILGVIYLPFHDLLYYAEKGTGAYVVKNSITVRLNTSGRAEDDLRFVRSVHHSNLFMETVAKKLSAIIEPRGSIGIKASVIAEGNGEFFCSQGNFGEWDVCAPEIITLESGGNVTDIRGEPLFYGTKDHRVEYGIIFSNGACHERVLSAVHSSSTPMTPSAKGQ